jgi:hypothetical protein
MGINKRDIGNLQRDGYGVSLIRLNEHNRVFLKVTHRNHKGLCKLIFFRSQTPTTLS